MSFSQNGEDLAVASLFPPDFKGKVLEIGAFDPVAFSNSRLFIEAGWSAALVEFSPGPLRNLLKAHGSNPNVSVFCGAVIHDHHLSHDFSFRRFDVTDDALSTNTPAVRKLWNEKGGYFAQMYVPAIPVEFFANSGADFLSVDTEGSSIDVLAGFLRSTSKFPAVIVVEHDSRYGELATLCKEFGYERIEHARSAGENAILKKLW